MPRSKFGEQHHRFPALRYYSIYPLINPEKADERQNLMVIANIQAASNAKKTDACPAYSYVMPATYIMYQH